MISGWPRPFIRRPLVLLDSPPQRTIDLPHLHQAVTHRPPPPNLPKRPINLIFRYLRTRSRDHQRSLALGRLQQLPVADDTGHAEARNARLPGPEEFSRAAQFEIKFGDLEPVVRA